MKYKLIMKPYVAVLALSLISFVGCQKESINYAPPTSSDNPTTPPVASTEGYVVVKCSNCKIDYGQPDQFKGYNVGGTSGNLPFKYTKGYTLNANLYALDRDQEITYSIYDPTGKQVFTNSLEQSTEGYWAVNVLLP